MRGHSPEHPRVKIKTKFIRYVHLHAQKYICGPQPTFGRCLVGPSGLQPCINSPHLQFLGKLSGVILEEGLAFPHPWLVLLFSSILSYSPLPFLPLPSPHFSLYLLLFPLPLLPFPTP